jgi:hypothetical protein
MRADTLRRESPRCAGGFGWIRSVFSTLRSSRAWPLVNTQGAPQAVSMPVVQPDADGLSCGPKARREPSSGSSGWRVFAADCWTGGQWRMGRFHKVLEGVRPRVPLSITALRQTHRERRPSPSARFWRTPGLRGPLDPGLRRGDDSSDTPVSKASGGARCSRELEDSCFHRLRGWTGRGVWRRFAHRSRSGARGRRHPHVAAKPGRAAGSWSPPEGFPSR